MMYDNQFSIHTDFEMSLRTSESYCQFVKANVNYLFYV